VPCVVSFLPAFSCPRKWLYEIVALMSSSVPICYIEPTSLNLAVAIILILAIPLSYVPQYISIIRAKSSEGMSCLSLAVLLLGGLLTLINHSILNWDSIICCGLLTVKSCLANNLPGFQLFVGPFCITILYAHSPFVNICDTKNDLNEQEMILANCINLNVIYCGQF
jgi:uncharacterized protein with PQ loop repeat